MNTEKHREKTIIELKHKDITDKILYAFFKIVYPQLITAKPSPGNKDNATAALRASVFMIKNSVFSVLLRVP